MDATQILSFGCMAGELQTPVSRLQEIAKQLGITPSSTINNVPYFNAADVERIADQIRSESQPEVVQ